MDTNAATQPEIAAVKNGKFWITIKRRRAKEVLVTLAPNVSDECDRLRDVWFDGVSDEFENSAAVPRLLDGDGTRSIMSMALACSCLARFLVSTRARRLRPRGHAETKIDLGPAPWDELCDAVERLRVAHGAAMAALDQAETEVETTVIVRAGLDRTPAMVGVEHHSKPTASALGHLVARALRDRLHEETSLDGAPVREILEGDRALIGPRVVRLEHASLAAAVDDWRDDPDVSHALSTGRVALDWRLGEHQGWEVDDGETRYSRPTRRCGDLVTVAQLVDVIPRADPMRWW